MAARTQNGTYLPNGTGTSGTPPVLPNQARIAQAGGLRVLCVADVRGMNSYYNANKGNLAQLNNLAKSANADYIIHTGDFGFYDDRSLDRIADKTLKHVAQYSPLINEEVRRQIANAPLAVIKEQIPRQQILLSQLPQFLSGAMKLNVPVYTVWGACEDVQVLEKIRSGEYKVHNLNILDEAHSRLLEVGGVKLRLLGLGGAVVMHKLFDNGEGRTTIAGGQGTMWTTLLQMGELIDTANRTYDPTETRVFVTHASPAREGLLNQLAVALKADFSISGGLHFRYGSSYNEFSVNPTLDHFRGKLAASKASFQDVWETVKSEVEPIVAENESHQKLLDNALEVVAKMPSVGNTPFGLSGVDEAAFKNLWNFNLADAAYGWLVLDIESGRIATEMKATGFNFSHRTAKQEKPQPVPKTVQPAIQSQLRPQPEQQPPKPAIGAEKTNGISSASPAPVEKTPPPEKKPSSGIFVENAANEEEVKKMFSESDQAKILRIEKMGHNSRNWAVFFENPETMQAVLAGASPEFKTASSGKPRMKVFDYHRRREFTPRPGQGYKSSGASDSESGRGRGLTFRGGRGRGVDRPRGRGRGAKDTSVPASAQGPSS